MNWKKARPEIFLVAALLCIVPIFGSFIGIKIRFFWLAPVCLVAPPILILIGYGYSIWCWRDQTRARKWLLAVLSAACLPILLFFIWAGSRGTGHPPGERMLRSSCAGHLKQIGQGLKMYAQDYGGFLPPTLDQVVPYTSYSSWTYICPSHRPEELPERAPVAEGILGYDYFGAGLHIDGDPHTIIAIDRDRHPESKSWHVEAGWNVLTLDFQVRFVSQKKGKLKFLRE